MKIPIGIVDDHQLVLKSVSLMLSSFDSFEVVLEASSRSELEQKIISRATLPEIMLVDVNMPTRHDGVASASWLNSRYPGIKLVAISMNDTDIAIIQMIKAGCCAYMLKDTHPRELEIALLEIERKGCYNGDYSNINYRRLIKAEREQELFKLSDNEKRFLNLAGSDLTYKEIAVKMNRSERTIDGYRESLFKKFSVQSRVGLVLEALRRNFITL